jgi:hypothetical protein
MVSWLKLRIIALPETTTMMLNRVQKVEEEIYILAVCY